MQNALISQDVEPESDQRTAGDLADVVRRDLISDLAPSILTVVGVIRKVTVTWSDSRIATITAHSHEPHSESFWFGAVGGDSPTKDRPRGSFTLSVVVVRMRREKSAATTRSDVNDPT